MKQPTQASFLKDVEAHQITINHDQGLFRDITIAKPNSIDMHYNITTRPGYLIFTGDMGSFTFKRVPDMFKFFRDDAYSINPSYWEEKVEAAPLNGGVKEFDCEVVKKLLRDELSEFISELDTEENSEDIETAKNAIEHLIRYTENDEYGYVSAIRDFDPGYSGGLDLTDFWENNVYSYTYRYIWCCYAIVHSINLYDQQIANEIQLKKQRNRQQRLEFATAFGIVMILAFCIHNKFFNLFG